MGYPVGSTSAFVEFSNMNRQHTSREGIPNFNPHSLQHAIVHDSHTYTDPESGSLRFAKNMNADGTPKMDLINDYYQIAMGTGMNDKAKELITDSLAGFTFKIVLEDKVERNFQPYVFGPVPTWEKAKRERHGDKNGIHYSF